MTSGSPIKLMIPFILPLFFGNVFQQIYSMVDTIIVGRFVSVEALAALGAVGGFSFMAVGFAQGLGTGFAVPVSQRYGAGDYKGMRKYYSMSILSSLFIGIIISVLFFVFSMPLLKLVNTPSNIIQMSNSYISVIYIGLLTAVYYNLFSAILRAVGDSRSPLLFLAVSASLNIFLDLLLVLASGWGCFGVGVATVIAQGISAVCSYIYINRKFEMFRLKKEDWKIDFKAIKRLISIGLPGAIQFSVCAVGVIIVQSVINPMGSNVVAAYSVGTKLENLYTQMFVAIGVGISTFAAQNLGAGNFLRIRKGFRASILLSAAWSLIALALAFFCSSALSNLFLGSDALPEVKENALLYVRITSYFFFPLSLIFVFRTGTQGLGSGAIPMISSITELVMRVITAFTLPRYLGYLGVCLASPVAWVGAAIILPICYLVKMRQIKKKLPAAMIS